MIPTRITVETATPWTEKAILFPASRYPMPKKQKIRRGVDRYLRHSVVIAEPPFRVLLSWGRLP